MKALLDFIPLIIFFVVYKLSDIFTASLALIIASAVALLISWLCWRKVEKMALITFLFVLVFGSLTYFLHNALFIKWKVTLIYLLFALALLLSQWLGRAPLIQRMLGKELTLPAASWKRLNAGWALFFLACGLLNIYVAFWLPQAVWVNFKVFGLTGLTLLATLISGLYIYRHMETDATKLPPPDKE